MIDKITTKIRSLVETLDILKSDNETFIYANSSVFNLTESNVESVTSVEKNGVELGSGEYSYDSTLNKVTITASLSNGDLITIYFTYYKYSDIELKNYIRASLVWLSIFAHEEGDYELEDDSISPTPDNKTTDLIALISSILINPDYTSYKLPNLTVIYRGRIPKDEKIKRLIMRFKYGLGVTDVLEFD